MPATRAIIPARQVQLARTYSQQIAGYFKPNGDTVNSIHKGQNDLGQYVTLVLDKEIYSDRAIMKTCYSLTDSYYIHITSSSLEQYTLYFYSKSGLSNDEVMGASAVMHFLEALNDNQLRQILLAETQAVHEEIVRKAFAPVTQLVARGCAEDELNIMISAV